MFVGIFYLFVYENKKIETPSKELGLRKKQKLQKWKIYVLGS